MYAKHDDEIVELTTDYIKALRNLMRTECDMMNEHHGCGWDWGRCTITDLSNTDGIEFDYGSADCRPADGLGQFGVITNLELGSPKIDRPNKNRAALLMINGKVVLIEDGKDGYIEWIETRSAGFHVVFAIDDVSPELLSALILVANGTLTQATFRHNCELFHAECIPAYALLMQDKKER